MLIWNLVALSGGYFAENGKEFKPLSARKHISFHFSIFALSVLVIF
jgi:hypothetical protein